MTINQKMVFLVGHLVTWQGNHYVCSGTYQDGTCNLSQDGYLQFEDVPLTEVELKEA